MSAICLTFSVMFSPTIPFPRVDPLTSLPSLYSNDTESPSILVSTTNSVSRPNSYCTLVTNSSTSPYEKTSFKLCIATSCVTSSNVFFAVPPTICVGEFLVTNSG